MASLSSFHRCLNEIKHIPLFKDLSLWDKARLARHARFRRYDKGEVISRQGEPADGVYCVISGRVHAFQTDEHGRKGEVAFFRRGSYFGVVSVLTGEGQVLTYEAINSTTVLWWPAEVMRRLIHDIPKLGVALSIGLSQRLRRRTRSGDEGRRSIVLSVFSPVAGAGASTYASHLAVILKQESRRKTAFVRLWPPADAPAPKQESPHALVRVTAPVHRLDDLLNEQALKSAMQAGPDGVDVLQVAVGGVDEMDEVGSFIGLLAHFYSFVILDLPSELDPFVLEVMVQSDRIHVVSFDEDEDLRATRRALDALEERLKDAFRPDHIKVILSGRYPSCYLSFEPINAKLDYDVAFQLPHLGQQDLIGNRIEGPVEMAMLNEGCEYLRVVRAMARSLAGVQVGLVLGGGAALGLAHIGVLRFLEEKNVPVDLVVGSSMGALVAAFWTTGYDSRRLERMAREFRSPVSLLKLFDPIVPIRGLIGGRMVKRWLRRHGLADKTFYATRIPLKILTFDLKRREEMVIESGPLVEAVRKSIGLPAIFPPVCEDGRQFIDGGIMNPLPVNVVTAYGVKKVIAVNVLQAPEHIQSALLMRENTGRGKRESPKGMRRGVRRVLARIGGVFKGLFVPNIPDVIVRTLQSSEFVIADLSGRSADVLIQPDLTGMEWYELHRAEELIARGYEAAQRAWPAIQRLIEEA